jgi:hypothetical protein
MAKNGGPHKISAPDRKVWVAHKATPTMTYKNAQEYGELRYLSQNTTTGKVNQFRNQNLTKRFLKKLRGSSPDDLILLSGYGSVQVLACLAFKEIHGHINVLIYNQRTRHYELRKNFGE